MRTARQEQARWRRERLIDAALTVFAAKGVDGASVKDIAEAAQVTPGLLYHYFDGKEALVAATLNERGFLPELRQLLDAQGDRPVSVVLPELIRAFDELLAANADLVSIFFSVSNANQAAYVALREFAATGRCLLGDYLQSRSDAGELRPHLAHTAASALFATVAIGHKTGQRVDVADLVELVLAGLRADGPAAMTRQRLSQ
jgi:AcrR family transcriptional regulator